MPTRLACGPLVTPWPKKETPWDRQVRGPFKVSYDVTFYDVERELDMIDAKRASAEFDMQPKMFRKLDSRPYSTGLGINSHKVLLRFERQGTELVFACDRYDQWTANLRAISLTLAALRAVDRYGATGGEQYRGFRRLGSGGAGPAAPEPEPEWSPRKAAEVLVTFDPASRGDSNLSAALVNNVLAHVHVFRIVEGIAIKAAHPDTGGSADAFGRVQRARKVLAAHFAGNGAAR